MENDEFKNIWKADADKVFKPFSEKELNDMIINSAKKSMRKLHPVSFFIVGFLFVPFTVWLIIAEPFGSLYTKSYLILLFILLGTLLIRLRSLYKMNNYRSDMPIKEWLQYRINSIDRTLRFQQQYGIWIAAIILICGLGCSILGLSGIELYTHSISLAIAILIMLWIATKSRKKGLQKIREVRDYLQRLYDGIGE